MKEQPRPKTILGKAWDLLRNGFISFVSMSMPYHNSFPSPDLPDIGPEAKVIIKALPSGSSDDALAKAVRRAALEVMDFSWLAKGDSVLVKPASNSGNVYPATTSPVGIRAMVELLKEKGAGRVIVSDMSGIEHVKQTPKRVRGSTRKLMQRNGIFQAAEKAGAELYFPEEHGWDAFFQDFPAKGSHWKGGIWIPGIIKDVDHIVLMPRTSRHVLAGATLGMKAAVGYLRFDSRLEYHRDAETFYEKTAEMNSLPSLTDKLRLVLTTATRLQTTFGPDDGYMVEPEVGLIIATESLVAHDMVSLAWLIENREQIPAGEKRGRKDPYSTNSAVISLLNAGVVLLLGGLSQVFRTDKLKKYDSNTIWDDPVLNRAFNIWGGVPMVKLIDTEKSVPEGLRNSLSLKLAPPSR
jgi:uncharacterized protein (DUF362 family)